MCDANWEAERRLGNAELEGRGALTQSAHCLGAGGARQPPFHRKNAALVLPSNKESKNWGWDGILFVYFLV